MIPRARRCECDVCLTVCLRVQWTAAGRRGLRGHAVVQTVSATDDVDVTVFGRRASVVSVLGLTSTLSSVLSPTARCLCKVMLFHSLPSVLSTTLL